MTGPSGELRRAFGEWFSSLQPYKQNAGLPARGTVAGALVILERLKSDYVLELDAHRTGGQSQLKGLTPSAVRKILRSFGETRPFSVEGGRTNRGLLGEVGKLLDVLRSFSIADLPEDERNDTLNELQRLLVEKVREFHERKRLGFSFDGGNTTWSAVHEILHEAGQVGKAGPVAQYLVGAKLQLKFPETVITNDRFSAGDVQTGRIGDFQVSDTAFHVTVAPAAPIFEKCLGNIKAGQRVYLLVPDNAVAGARQNAEAIAPDRIAVESLESFIANNIEERSYFSKDRLVAGFRSLLEEYNRRVDDIELDKSLLIEIPASLA